MGMMMMSETLWTIRGWRFVIHPDLHNTVELIGPDKIGHEMWAEDGFLIHNLMFYYVPKDVRARAIRTACKLLGAEY